MTALVTGGGGFVGGAVVDALLARGEPVVSLARGDYPALRERGVTTVRGDLTDPVAVREALVGCDTVFHVAARAGIRGTVAQFRHSNVEGTRVLLDACRAAGVRRFVFTSTPSVVHTGGDIAGGDESLPYATHFDAAYPETKAEAERLVLAANGPDLATVALRPHLVWGPGDTQLVPRILARARAGRLRFVGDGSAVIDTTYVDDAARAHLDAADRLAPGAACAGRPYFITSGDPRPVRELVNGIVVAGGLEPVRGTVPVGVAVAAGAAVESVWRVLDRVPFLGDVGDPPMTRFLARQLATAHWFDISAARRDLGYEPRVSLDEGFARLSGALRAREH
ncbi:NAD-dependent epimerase/dehydratase family protein [Actinomycetospora sp. TBRC 11914]|uniref:NAD-dependent epimerase/dehydratase family protein n=1 Tax=Actinomycetospora sp. TBRC 11914 TaxID=2729387 RepID=UPI00145E3DBB|nr:NAD-dependent epimerase/dehydratase family protein [Actinomycetospora sp. TBRC 11914]NMO93025.1 NAD-dependent epimerase/dehydratase family protein [Actinomycetospora sp. TBRC 11914]